MDKYYRNSWMNVVENVGSNLSKGLLEYDCILRREEFGDNSISLPLKGVIKNKFKYTINFITILINIVLFSLFLSSKKYEWALIFAAVIIIELVYKVFYILKQVKNS